MTEVVQIGSGNEYHTYATVAQADDYLLASVNGTSWRALETEEEKARFLVSATRILDQQPWLGEKTEEDQPLAWPRTGTGVTGVEDDVVPQDIINASIELAAALVDNAAIATQQSTEQGIQSLKAGSAAITYFRGANGTPARFPHNIMEMIRKYLDGYNTTLAGGVFSSGTSAETVTGDDFGYAESL